MATHSDLTTAISAIKAHAACKSFLETPQKYVVFYPSTYKVPGGAGVDKGSDALAAANRLYNIIDTFWSNQRLKLTD